MTAYINTTKHQLLEVTSYTDYHDIMNPLENEDPDIEFHITYANSHDIQQDIADILFNGDYDAYNVEHDRVNSAYDLFENLKKIAQKQNMILIPISRYEHSAICYSTGVSDGWDRGCCGFVIVNPAADFIPTDITDFDKKTAWVIDHKIDPILEDFNDYVNGYLSTITLSKLDSDNQIEDEIAVTDVYDHEIDENKVESLLYQMDINVDEAKDWQLADSKSVTYTTYFPAKEEE